MHLSESSLIALTGTQIQVQVHLLESTWQSPATRLIMPMRYMWSAMLSGPGTPFLTHPVRLVTLSLCSRRKKSIALFAVVAMPRVCFRGVFRGRGGLTESDPS